MSNFHSFFKSAVLILSLKSNFVLLDSKLVEFCLSLNIVCNFGLQIFQAIYLPCGELHLPSIIQLIAKISNKNKKFWKTKMIKHVKRLWNFITEFFSGFIIIKESPKSWSKNEILSISEFKKCFSIYKCIDIYPSISVYFPDCQVDKKS